MSLNDFLILVGLGAVILLALRLIDMHNARLDAQEVDPLVEAVQRGEQQ